MCKLVEIENNIGEKITVADIKWIQSSRLSK